MHTMRRAVIFFAGLMVGLALMAPEGMAQARKVVVPQASAKDKVEIKKFEGLGQAARVKSPEYQLNPSETSPTVREWARITARFETDADWTDELEFRYFVQVHNAKNNTDLLFPGTFQYIDIPKGKNHLSTVFLRPATLDRYGDVIGIAVEIYAKGEMVAFACNPETPKGWWRLTTAKAMPGVLLERSQTPFAFVAFDSYVTAKPK